MPLSQYEIVKDLLFENDKIVGYITGYSTFNELGLTTQINNTIQIGKNDVRPALKRGMYKITFIKQKNKITRTNISLLKILDAIRFIKRIPGATIEESCKRLLAIIRKLNEADIKLITRLSLLYPPATRALLGAIMEAAKKKSEIGLLKKSLNPISIYKLNISTGILSTVSNWNIQ